LVVPRSIPITFAMSPKFLFVAADRPDPQMASVRLFL
jgi:hypothetical protein